jgi:hypothetical protein
MTILQGSAANAASDYDNVIHSTPTVKLSNESVSLPVDITSNWRSDVESGCSGFTVPLGDAISSSSGAWAVVQEHAVAPSPAADGSLNVVFVVWTSDKSANPTQWSTNLATVTGENIARLFLDRSGNVQCTNISWAGSRALSYSGTAVDGAYLNSYLHSTFLPNYPPGYAGEMIQTGLYSGTIDCGGLEVEGVLISQSGNSGAASWSYASPGTATWNYPFNSNSYSITIGCGGTPSAWATTNYSPGSVDPATVSNDWVCDVFSHYCVLG